MIREMLSRLFRRLPPVRELSHLSENLKTIQAQLSDLRRSYLQHCWNETAGRRERWQEEGRLLRHQFQVSSQNGEDGILHEILKRLGSTSRVFVEVGVGDGTENNTAFLLSQGWCGYWIDSDGAFLRTIDDRPDLANGCVKGLVSLVTRENVCALFEQLNVPREIDLLSIDIDQNTYYIWEALAGYRPRIVVVEYNAALPPDVMWKVQYDARRTWDGTQNFGASLLAFQELAARQRYSLVGCDSTGANAFFVRNDLVGDQFCSPYTAENHYEPLGYSHCFRRGHKASILDRSALDESRPSLLEKDDR